MTPAYVGIDVAFARYKSLPISICIRNGGRLLPIPLKQHPRSLPRGYGNPATLDDMVASASTATPETIRLKEVECDAEQRRVANFIEFVAEGRGSRALGDALTASETRLKELRIDLEGLRRSQDEVFLAPPREWLTERIASIQTVLERRTERSALLPGKHAVCELESR